MARKTKKDDEATNIESTEDQAGADTTESAETNVESSEDQPVEVATADVAADGEAATEEPEKPVKKRKSRAKKTNVEEAPTSNITDSRLYSVKDNYEVDATFDHPEFGKGTVVSVIPQADTCGACQLGTYGDPAKMVVKFASGEKTLVQNLKG
jgi:hypothetical protein